MPNPSKALLETEEILRSIIQALIDSQEGFQKIGAELKNETLRGFFRVESLRRGEFRGELENLLHQEGVHDVNESGTMAGTVRGAWADLKVKLGGGDHTLLVTAEQAEDEAKRAYKEALEKDLPLPIRQTLTGQFAHIQASHDYVRNARDSNKQQSTLRN
ncbi:MAG: PA2169 family four-helix-bundle protein [Terracidiphilus sp.]|jgi:uncharacterized protein (TIGR02284 family)